MKESKLKPKFKIADNFIDSDSINSQIIIEHIEQQIELREMPIEEHAAHWLKKLKR